VRRLGDARGAVDAQLDARAATALGELERAALQPPEPAELAARLGCSTAEAAAVLELLVDRGRARRVGALFFAEARVAEARAAVEENCRAHAGALDIPSLRDRLGTSRKFLIPLLEAFDAEGLTLRQGARRVLRAPRAPRAPRASRDGAGGAGGAGA
jgi:selenocysteine-specific elongation factor